METNKPNAEPTHKELLLKAKQRQREDLSNSDLLSEQLANSLRAIIKDNSAPSNQNCSPLVDKIITIHELSDEIDRQLNKDIASNFEDFLHAKDKLALRLAKCKKKLGMDNKEESYIDLLQRRLELIDQDIRVLEYTSKLLEEHKK
ncbi:hypothetical protein A9F13_20g00781 [Clavispora lusitaniae]|uniref:Uncharacterized protein n=1 Tax=Clavispora lusitaniae TaxID=36911 RepID=A0AA91PW23_CLALS|nr:hypothetical protein A9F13_20g00781 [Clavispora lusitaniae]